jgi:hypothetical protein
MFTNGEQERNLEATTVEYLKVSLLLQQSTGKTDKNYENLQPR